ncbi:MAG: peroxiredoxin-like family protein [Phycisphaerae bacterium]
MNRLTTVCIAGLGLLISGCASDSSTPSARPVPEKAENVKPLAEGDSVPAVTLRTPSAEPVNLAKVIAEKPTLIVFYRGGWCPYCNTHLAGLAKIQPELVEMGYQIVAISPDRPAELTETAAGQKLDYQLLSDSDVQAARAFGLAFRVEDELVSKYLNEYQIDLEAASGRDHHVLPVPAVYLVDTDGTIRFAHVDPNYRDRLSAERILAVARENRPVD